MSVTFFWQKCASLTDEIRKVVFDGLPNFAANFAFDNVYFQHQVNTVYLGEILVKWGLILTLWSRQTECNQACHIRHHQAVLRHCPPSISAVLGTERTADTHM